MKRTRAAQIGIESAVSLQPSAIAKAAMAAIEIGRMAAAPVSNGAEDVSRAPEDELDVEPGRDPCGRIGEARHDREQNGRGEGALGPEQRDGAIDDARGRDGQEDVGEMGGEGLEGKPERSGNEQRSEQPEERRGGEIAEAERPRIVVAGDPVLPVQFVVAVEARDRDDEKVGDEADRDKDENVFPRPVAGAPSASPAPIPAAIAARSVMGARL